MRTRPINPTDPNEVDPSAKIHTGLGDLCRRLIALGQERTGGKRPARVIIDGMWGADFDQVRRAMLEEGEARGLTVSVWETAWALHSAEWLRSRFEPWLTDNPTFGRVCPYEADAYFDEGRCEELKRAYRSDSKSDVTLLLGPYALEVGGEDGTDVRVYLDLPREDIIEAQNEGLVNLGFGTRGVGVHSPYKVAYYVEWPLLERHKRRVIYGDKLGIDVYVSCHGAAYTWVDAPLLKEMIRSVSRRPFRCKPFFMPGVWGGHRLQEAAGIGEDWANCAWDFEIVAPENSLIIGHGDASITIPFHLMMWQESEAILGALPAYYFGEFFPIRFNYLDTMGGTNLSCQVHPEAAYIRDRFGEEIPQHETYYVVENKPGAKVYLGFRETTTRENFAEVVRKAEEEAVPFDIADYVAEWESHVGDLFLIPAGTVHCSGADNLVLEISSTTYWYTFKIYDYLRPDLTGKPRPINSKYAFDVLDFTRKESWVKRHLLPRPMLVREEAGAREYHLGSSHLTFYGVNRLEIEGAMRQETKGSFHILTVVAGDGVRIVTGDAPAEVRDVAYLETFVVPEACGSYVLEAASGPCKLVKAYIKQ